MLAVVVFYHFQLVVDFDQVQALVFAVDLVVYL